MRDGCLTQLMLWLALRLVGLCFGPALLVSGLPHLPALRVLCPPLLGCLGTASADNALTGPSAGCAAVQERLGGRLVPGQPVGCRQGVRLHRGLARGVHSAGTTGPPWPVNQSPVRPPQSVNLSPLGPPQSVNLPLPATDQGTGCSSGDRVGNSRVGHGVGQAGLLRDTKRTRAQLGNPQDPAAPPALVLRVCVCVLCARVCAVLQGVPKQRPVASLAPAMPAMTPYSPTRPPARGHTLTRLCHAAAGCSC